MTYLYLILGLISGFAVVRYLNRKVANHRIKRLIEPIEAWQLVRDDKVYILDIQPAEMYLRTHLQNAENIDYSLENFDFLISRLNKTKHYLIYDWDGSWIKEAANRLRKSGFANVVCLEGGINHWKKEGYPADSQVLRQGYPVDTEKTSGQET
ncbi:MAG: rhodanese-like domain-containing protein [Candidatus Cloacimonetes bacterium]|nr:rhodanese-like domain-containing protein [Candidatus Cloacimonadota bacterium]